MKLKIAVATISAIAVAGAGTGGVAYWKSKIDYEKLYLQEKIALLKNENEDLKERINTLKEKNQKYKIKLTNQSTLLPPENDKNVAITDEEQIRELVRQEIANQGTRLSLFEKIDVDISGTWSLAKALPEDKKKYETMLYVFEKDYNEWELKDSGSGLTKEDFPYSPDELWDS